MEFFTDEVMRGLLAETIGPAGLVDGQWKNLDATLPGSREGDYIDWLTIRDQAQSVRDDVARIRRHPLVPPHIAIYGYIYDVRTGLLAEVPPA
jgi:carbonic anhydrase